MTKKQLETLENKLAHLEAKAHAMANLVQEIYTFLALHTCPTKKQRVAQFIKENSHHENIPRNLRGSGVRQQRKGRKGRSL